MARPVGIPSHRKGVSMLDEYGVDRATSIKKQISDNPNVKVNLGKKLECTKTLAYRKKRSEIMKKKYEDEEFKKSILEKSFAGGFGKHKKPYVPTQESKEKNRLWHLGKKQSVESKQKERAATRAKILSGELTPSFSAKICIDLGFRVRSKYEANFCRLLNFLNIPYEYESVRCRFDLDDTIYICDFYFPQCNFYLELKPGKQYRQLGFEKLAKCITLYPDKDIFVLNRIDYLVLDKKYRNIIPNWETYERSNIY